MKEIAARITAARDKRPGGGIGRRAGFRYLWGKPRGSSSLLLGTTIAGILARSDTAKPNIMHDKAPDVGQRTDSDLKIELHKGDLPKDLDLGPMVAVDTETMGLDPARDRLCLVQLSSGDGTCHLVQLTQDRIAAPNLSRLLTDRSILKIFHFARFDVAMLNRYLGIVVEPVYCTKIASKLVRTYTDKHGLKDLAKELLGIDLSKQQQSSDWGAPTLTQAQQQYAASDVLHLHALKQRLDEMLTREGRTELAQACFDFLQTRAQLDLSGWANEDIFAH